MSTYRPTSSLAEPAQRFLEHIRETKSAAWHNVVRWAVVRFESWREAEGLALGQAFPRAAEAFAESSPSSAAQAATAVRGFAAWAGKKVSRSAWAKAPPQARDWSRARQKRSKTKTRAARPESAASSEKLVQVLERIGGLADAVAEAKLAIGLLAANTAESIGGLGSQVAAIVKRLDESGAPDPGRSYEADAPKAFLRTQLERVIGQLGMEEAAQVLGVNFGTFRNTMAKREGIPHVDIARLDEVYVACRVIALDLDASDLLDECERLLRARKRRDLDDLTTHQREH